LFAVFSKVVYRYSMLNQNEDKDVDQDIERVLTGETAHPVFSNASDEEVGALRSLSESVHAVNNRQYGRMLPTTTKVYSVCWQFK
jgi:hypothetical protein